MTGGSQMSNSRPTQWYKTPKRRAGSNAGLEICLGSCNCCAARESSDDPRHHVSCREPAAAGPVRQSPNFRSTERAHAHAIYVRRLGLNRERTVFLPRNGGGQGTAGLLL